MTRAARRSATLLAIAACFLLAPAISAAKVSPNTDAVRKANDALRVALKKMVAAKGADWDKAREQARVAVSSLLDFDALAEGTLGKRWGELKPPERKRYVDAMRSAMEASYLARMQSRSEAVKAASEAEKQAKIDEVKVEYLGEERKDGHPLVRTKFTAGEDSAAIDYVLDKGGKKPRAIDVITEGVSLAETYREQITQLWPKKGYEGVVTAFEKKAKRFEADLEAKRKGDGQ